MKKFCTSLREYAKKYKLFRKEENDTVNKRRLKIISRCKSMLYLWKRFLEKVC